MAGIAPRDWAVLVLAIAMVFTADSSIPPSKRSWTWQAQYIIRSQSGQGCRCGRSACRSPSAAILIGLLILGPPLWAKLELLFTGN